MRKPSSSESQLSFSDCRYGELCHLNFHQTAIDSRTVPLDNAARDIGVEQAADPHQNDSRGQPLY